MSGSKHIAFLGLGVMGGPMAGHLLRAGHSVTVYNRTAARAQAWLERFGGDGTARIAATPAAAAQGAQVVISCVGNDADLAQVMRGPDGALAALAAGALVIDHTTVGKQTQVTFGPDTILYGPEFTLTHTLLIGETSFNEITTTTNFINRTTTNTTASTKSAVYQITGVSSN